MTLQVKTARASASRPEFLSGSPPARRPFASAGISIATTHTQARFVLPEVLRRFRDINPHLPLHLRQGDSAQIGELMARGEADIALASGSNPAFTGLLRVPCFRWRRVIVTPDDHPLAVVSQPTLAQLARWPLVTYSLSNSRTSSLMAAFNRERLNPEIAVTSWDSGVLKACIRAGLGVGILADLAIDGREDADLSIRNVDHLFEPLTTWIGVPTLAGQPDSTFELLSLLAPQYSTGIVSDLRHCSTQPGIDRLIAQSAIPFRR